jgi:hypothetical protein
MMTKARFAFLWLLPFMVSGFCHSSIPTRRQRQNHQLLHLSSITTPSHNEGRPRNEFCRTVPPDKILKLAGRTVQQQQYSLDIEASPEECQALAQRFSLPRIASLGASLALAPEDRSTKGIVVEGTGHATVTRICVRTNEPFEANLEFAIECLVRPVDGFGPLIIMTAAETNNQQEVKLVRDNRKSKNSQKRKNKGDVYYEEEDMDIDPKELQKMESMLDNLDSDNARLEDILMEDDNIYATNGRLDIGELVAQLFWLDLDPYPRKPGSEFLQFSISG